VKGPAMIARLATELGIPRFVHVSHLNASPDSKSAFYRTKYEGEERVRQEFANASIIRPAIMYGHEDKLLNNMACESFSRWRIYLTPHVLSSLTVWSIWWHLNHGQTKVRPAHVSSVLHCASESPYAYFHSRFWMLHKLCTTLSIFPRSHKYTLSLARGRIHMRSCWNWSLASLITLLPPLPPFQNVSQPSYHASPSSLGGP
jgi:hypothetical protein